MGSTFTNNNPMTINPGEPNTVLSSINVSGLSDDVKKIKVTVDIDHTWTGDLRISLLSPAGLRVILAQRRGGSSDDFKDVTFDQDAPTSIRNAISPFTGTYRPEGDLSDFNGRLPDGNWQLEVRDLAFQDGGELRSWSIELETQPVSSQYSIDIRFLGGLTGSQQDAFAIAAGRWSSIITGDVPDATLQGEVVDDLRIDARGAAIDGVGGILGQAGPTWIRSGSHIPIAGVMTFDRDDLQRMEDDGVLLSVILHEMAHVIGIGTIWSYKGLLQGAGSIDPTFSGANAMREFGTLLVGSSTPTAVPVANTGGPGTRDSHWREAVFGNELMTGFIGQGGNPLSRLTISSLADLGYQVDLEAADQYTLPSPIMMAMMGVGVESTDHNGYGIMLPTDIGVLE